MCVCVCADFTEEQIHSIHFNFYSGSNPFPPIVLYSITHHQAFENIKEYLHTYILRGETFFFLTMYEQWKTRAWKWVTGKNTYCYYVRTSSTHSDMPNIFIKEKRTTVGLKWQGGERTHTQVHTDFSSTSWSHPTFLFHSFSLHLQYWSIRMEYVFSFVFLGYSFKRPRERNDRKSKSHS